MRSEHITLPVTSVATATLIGIVTTAVILLTVHPTMVSGGLAAIAAVGGGFVLAGGLVALEKQTPIGVSTGGIATFVGTLLIVASIAVTSFNTPPIAAVAAGFAISGVATLAFVAVGYTDPSLFRIHSKLLVQVAITPLILGLVLLNSPSLSLNAATSAITSTHSAYLRTISKEGMQVSASITLIHLFAVYLLIYATSSQFKQLDLISYSQQRRVSRLGLKAIFIIGFVALGPPLIYVISRLSMFSGSETVLSGIPSILELQPLFFGAEAVLLTLLCLSFVLRIIRWARLEQAVTLVSYLVVPFILTISVTTTFTLAPNELVLNRFLVHVPGYNGFSMEQLIGIAALSSGLIFVLLSVALTTLWLSTGVIYRLESRGVPATTSAGLFLGAALLGFTGAWPPVVACCLIGSILTWDILENGVTLGEQLNGRFNAIQNELAHGLASGAVGGLAVVIALGTYSITVSLQSGKAPSLLILSPLLFAGVTFALALRYI
ncbi:hypothetical protein ACFOZ7_12325 [Natribaculum luteum]|uniref:Oligopeptide transporter, OPT family n=1 Tax=Natribaculum luteum TaxID=1586232 RepID=A0ABD5P1A0_9EURY|nr:hypothetical protein [Natribaculum luteum]